MSFEPTKEQNAVLDAVGERIAKGMQQTTIGGWAGTGKSVLLTVLLERLKEKKRRVQVCATTNKACDVLRTKGIESKTVHSFLTYVKDKKTEEHEKIWLDGTRQKYHAVISMEFADRKVSKKFDVLLVDESSMLDKEMYARIISTGLPVVFFGDHGQLPAFGGKNAEIMSQPDFRLETVHRNAGEIARFSAHLRKGGLPRSFMPQDDTVQLNDDEAYKADQIVVGKHKSRLAINWVNAKHPEKIHVGDRLISLKTDRNLKISRGSIVTATKVDEWDVHWLDSTGTPRASQYDPQFLLTHPAPDPDSACGHPFDFAWAITCHSAQGSEWESVAVVDESHCWISDGLDVACAWRYTAATRAKKKLWWS